MTAIFRLTHKKFGCPKGLVSSLILIIIYLYTHGVNLLCQVPDPLVQCSSKWVLHNPRVPQRCIRGSKRQPHNGGTVLLAVLNLYVQIKIHVATFNTNLSVTYSCVATFNTNVSVTDSRVATFNTNLSVTYSCVATFNTNLSITDSHVATFNTNPSITDSIHSITASIQKLPDLQSSQLA
jgi:hypothetical protein